ncbi:MAG: 1-acyl-sn-glycerol-3-phosphate acyltransferase [Treponema sp.]|nr:1-acyl-sn-glycerol-3-phosphate acyltransferase [Treponema sp.]
MTENSTCENIYSFENPPPIKNYPLYCWHIFAKILSFALFGLGTILISILAFPIMKLFFWKKERFRKAGHHFISIMFRFFVCFMTVIRSAHLTAPDKKKFRSLKSSIIVANHPSLLDVVMLISLIPDADCIVQSYLMGKNIAHIIVSNLYIPTSLSYEEIMEKCMTALKSGSNLIIFPEGTRSLPSGQNKFKKGAARIALASGCPIIPVYMGGNDKRGLRKHDPMFKYNTRHCYHYQPHMKEPLYPDEYKDMPGPAAAKKITKRLKEILSDENNKEYIKVYQ